MAGNVIESGWLKPIAEKIVRKCDGLPIAITTIGRALHSKGEGIWNDVLRRLENPSPENVSEEEVVKKVFRNIEFCFNCLHSKESKSFFFLCCIYPEGSDIQVEDLVRHGLGLGLFKNISSMVEGRNRVEALIDRLKDRSLLLNSNKKGCFKMHDLVRKVALLLDSSMSHKRDGVIITRNSISKCVRFHDVSGSRENQILLSCSDDSKQQRGAILKVLDCKRLLLAQPLFQRLKTIQTLCLEHCDLVDVSIIGKLKMLTILSLRHSSMNELPQSLRNLSNLWLLDLTGCKIRNPEIISSGIISGLKKLQELYMLVLRSHGESLPQEVEEREEVVSELLSWQCSLTTFEADLPESSYKSLQRINFFDKLERFKISIGCSGRWDMIPSHNNFLRLNIDADTLVEGSQFTELLKKTQTLEISVNVLEGECFSGLKWLKFEGGNTLNDIFCNILDGTITAKLFHVLRSLTIKSSKMLSSHCISQIPKGLFQELRCVELRSFPSLSSLFTLSMARVEQLHQLEELDIHECSQLKEIIEASEEEIKDIKWICELPNLIRLELVDLKNFVRFSPVSIHFPLLINIQLEKLPKLVTLYSNDTAPSSSSTTTQHLFDAKAASLLELRFVKVLSCDLISNMFSSNSMQSLQNLEDLIVEDCQSLRVLFNFEDLNIKTKNTSSTLLCITNMNLLGLPKLEYIWKPHQKIQAFQRLKSVRINRCDLLKNVFPCYIAEGLVELEEFYVSDCPQMTEIIYIDEESGDREFEASSTKKIVFSRVRTLELKRLPSLVRFLGAHCVLEWPLLKKLELADLLKVKKCFSKHLPDVAGLHSYIFHETADFPILEELRLSNMPELLVVVPFHMQHKFVKLELLSVSDCELVTEIFELRDASILETNALLITGDIMGPAYRNLRTLNISQCNSLRTLLSHSTAKSLERLKELSVCSCKNIEQILSKPAEGEESEINTNILPNLALLSLTDLPNLTSFTEGKYNLEWQFLSKFKFWGCPDMLTFCFGSAHTRKLLTMELSIDQSGQDISFRDLNLVISRIYRGESFI